jgi:hypothetical protein
MSEIRVTTLKDTSGGNSSSTADIFSGRAKAWVNFNASSGTPTIRSSYNINSITDEATGKFTLNFTSALSDANYTITCSNGNTGSTSSTGFIGAYLSSSTTYQSKTSSSVYMGVLSGNNAAFLDHFDVNVSVDR